MILQKIFAAHNAFNLNQKFWPVHPRSEPYRKALACLKFKVRVSGY